MDKEIWKTVPTYNGYEVSNTGKVRSIDRVIYSENRSPLKLKGRHLKTVIGKGKLAYYSVMLSENGKQKRWRVHQLVAAAFIPNPDNCPCINHIDGDKLNNNVDNLEWCTYSMNNEHAHRTGLNQTVDRMKAREKIYKLEKALDKANGCIEFYADANHFYGEVSECDLTDESGDKVQSMGKLARQTKKEIEEILNPE